MSKNRVFGSFFSTVETIFIVHLFSRIVRSFLWIISRLCYRVNLGFLKPKIKNFHNRNIFALAFFFVEGVHFAE